MIGLETKGKPLHIKNAMLIGIQQFFHEIFADLAVVKTGERIRATTAGRIPLNMLDSTWFCCIVSGVRKIAILRIIKKDGKIVPKVATIAPGIPLIL